jgi:hypothetical protein
MDLFNRLFCCFFLFDCFKSFQIKRIQLNSIQFCHDYKLIFFFKLINNRHQNHTYDSQTASSSNQNYSPPSSPDIDPDDLDD